MGLRFSSVKAQVVIMIALILAVLSAGAVAIAGWQFVQVGQSSPPIPVTGYEFSVETINVNENDVDGNPQTGSALVRITGTRAGQGSMDWAGAWSSYDIYPYTRSAEEIAAAATGSECATESGVDAKRGTKISTGDQALVTNAQTTASKEYCIFVKNMPGNTYLKDTGTATGALGDSNSDESSASWSVLVSEEFSEQTIPLTIKVHHQTSDTSGDKCDLLDYPETELATTTC